MEPADAVRKLAEFVRDSDTFAEDDSYDALAAGGVPFPMADRAYKFTQVAWGRAVLDGLGIEFAPHYYGFDAAGDVCEFGPLLNQPYYLAAVALAPEFAGSPGFKRLALMSADVHAVSAAINNGSKPADLLMSPTALFLAAPRPGAVAKVQRFLGDEAKKRGTRRE